MTTKGYCYIPRTGVTWEYEVADEFDLIETVKEMEDVKRIPPTWRLSIVKDGKIIEINRSSASRRAREKKH